MTRAALKLIAVLPLLFSLALPVAAEPVLKIVNFTADWCPNCKILNPRLAAAIDTFETGEVEVIKVDLTKMKGASAAEKAALMREVDATLMKHDVRYLWDWYAGSTGLAVMVAADNGEPLTCVAKIMPASEIAARIEESLDLARDGTPGARRPEGPDCIAPTVTGTQ